MAGNGLAKIRFARAKSLLNGTQAGAIATVAGKYAIFVLHNGRNKIAVGIHIHGTVFGDDFFRFLRKPVPNNGHDGFQLRDFVHLDGRTRIALNAAAALASGKVAAKKLLKNVQTNNRITNPYHLIRHSSLRA
jgi:hypothetical protein